MGSYAKLQLPMGRAKIPVEDGDEFAWVLREHSLVDPQNLEDFTHLKVTRSCDGYGAIEELLAAVDEAVENDDSLDPDALVERMLPEFSPAGRVHSAHLSTD